MEEALNAVRNLNGIKVRGKILKVSISKYGRDSLLWPKQVLHKGIKGAKNVRSAKGAREGHYVARSYIEVVEGKYKCLKGEIRNWKS